ncbi:hypothetical protein ACOSQ2_030694 [Xanthoceras sorbifolium]
MPTQNLQIASVGRHGGHWMTSLDYEHCPSPLVIGDLIFWYETRLPIVLPLLLPICWYCSLDLEEEA